MSNRKVIFAHECPTCARPANNPWRVWDGGQVVHGCVDHFHTGHLIVPSASAAWHNRKEARETRAAAKRMRDGFVTERTP